jgi:hypothetical protein
MSRILLAIALVLTLSAACATPTGPRPAAITAAEADCLNRGVCSVQWSAQGPASVAW